jgi:hypothetical protein
MTDSRTEAKARSQRGGFITVSDQVLLGSRRGPQAAGYKNIDTLFLAFCMSAQGHDTLMLDARRAVAVDTRFEVLLRRMMRLERLKGSAAAERYFDERWATATRRRADSLMSPHEVVMYWSTVGHRLIAVPFPGKGGAGQLAVLLAVVLAGLADHNVRPRLSRVGFQLATGLSESSVRRAIAAAIERGLLIEHPPRELGHSSRWTVNASAITDRAVAIDGYFMGGLSPSNSTLRLMPNHPVWAGRSLIRGHWHVFQVLAFMGQVSECALATVTGNNAVVTRRSLLTMATYGLVVSAGDHEWVVGPNDLDAVAEQLNLVKVANRRDEAAIQTAAQDREYLHNRDQAVRKDRDYREWKQAYWARSVQPNGRGGLVFTKLETPTWQMWRDSLATDTEDKPPAGTVPPLPLDTRAPELLDLALESVQRVDDDGLELAVRERPTALDLHVGQEVEHVLR